ncbi:uncharacterized protein SPPG_08719 [Spizellomyces punctatus DAOM BR117]|uniref:Uncharacterized protein n=1 Tax=Spizellomyces punctatus (strain DAOM BR117) TaxID=645134 RepID=A0A0L0H4E5_SPIPD|nr:uncharacterized protein SPPG_08719 [Spizellomyces punctatus DAOM BR117]KNC95854.1 hypothetical protein SPPG_08719 [Spizellomyces punctatus DAOM BR117]|eukprot:XP_016603894.1 hypothetical protein SPPG_08719 [Spizellomyces punctatus DAOM BR117]
MGPTELMVEIHPYMAAFALIFLFAYGLWAGFISPLGYLLKLRFFTEGYSHKPHLSLCIFSVVTSLAVVGSILAVSFRLHGSEGWTPVNFFSTAWAGCNYWTTSPEYQQEPAVFFYVYGSQILMTILEVAFCVMARWGPRPMPATTPAPENHAYIVVCHNSSDILKRTIPAILALVRPHQIYIADNGSTQEEEVLTDALCIEMSEAYYRSHPELGPQTYIQVAHIPVGSKTLAQYSTVHHLLERFRVSESSVDTVTIIDDDVIMPSFWSYETVNSLMKVPGTVALAYPLRAANQDQTICATLQDIEYLGGNVHRFAQDAFGSQLWASGAIATWRLEQLKLVLDRHCTVFNGEDLEMGYIMHKLSGRPETDKLAMDIPLRIGYVQDCVVPTVVPPCWCHWYDFIPAGRKRTWKVRPCDCGEHSFFNQRLRSWDPASHQYFVKFLTIVFSRGGWCNFPKNFIRVLCTWKVLGLLREYILFITVIYSFARVRNTKNLLYIGVFWADCLIIAWAHLAARLLFTSKNLRKISMAIRPDALLAYPILYGFPYEFLIRLVVVFYTFLYYLFAKPFPDPIRKQIVENPSLGHTLHSAWKRGDDPTPRLLSDGHQMPDSRVTLLNEAVPFMPDCDDPHETMEVSRGPSIGSDRSNAPSNLSVLVQPQMLPVRHEVLEISAVPQPSAVPHHPIDVKTSIEAMPLGDGPANRKAALRQSRASSSTLMGSGKQGDDISTASSIYPHSRQSTSSARTWASDRSTMVNSSEDDADDDLTSSTRHSGNNQQQIQKPTTGPTTGDDFKIDAQKHTLSRTATDGTLNITELNSIGAN